MRSFPRGTVLGPYVVEREIARGGMGTVLEARRRLDGAVVALKVLSIEGASPAQLARFEREAELAARLSHPGIVRVHERGREGPLPWIAMDLVDGRPLSELVGRLAPLEAARLVAQVARALEHAHAHRVVHRDLKPSNVLVRRDGLAVVTDFGVARDASSDALTRTGALVGTPQYMSPEQASGRPVGPASDVHALGALLHAAITGSPPFRATHLVELLAAITTAPPVPPGARVPDVPPALDRLVLSALAKEPRARPGAGAFAAELEAIAEGRVRQGSPTRWIALGAGAACVALGTLSLLALPEPEARPSAVAPPASRTPPPPPPAPAAEPTWLRGLASRTPGALPAAFDALLAAPAPLDPRKAARASQVLAGLDASWVEPPLFSGRRRAELASELLLIHAVWRLIDPTHEPHPTRARLLGDQLVVEIGAAMIDLPEGDERTAAIRLARACVLVFPRNINGYLMYSQCASTRDPGRDEAVVRRGIELALELGNDAAWGELVDNHARWLSHRAVFDVPRSAVAAEELRALARAIGPEGRRAPRSAANVLLYSVEVIPPDEARANMVRAEELIGRIGVIEHGWSIALHAAGDLEGAIAASRRAVAQAPPGSGVANWDARLSNLLVAAGRVEAACEVLEQAIQRDRFDPALALHLALTVTAHGGSPAQMERALSELGRRAKKLGIRALADDAAAAGGEAAAGDPAAVHRRLEPWLGRLAGVGQPAQAR